MEIFVADPLRQAAGVLVLGASLLGGCSPTFNWRELRLEGAPLLALMPCKPDTASRSVPMLGQPTELHMHSCEAGGLTFALAWAKVGDAGSAAAALEQWQAASLASIHASPGAASSWTLDLPKAEQIRGSKAQGTDHRGQPLQSQVAYFSQGSWVFQAAVYGSRLPEQATTPFFDGLIFP
jgi:hypothetical protein